MEIPAPVLALAADYLASFPGSSVEYLGDFNGADAFVFETAEESTIGLPIVFLHRKGKAEQVPGLKALGILALLGEDA